MHQQLIIHHTPALKKQQVSDSANTPTSFTGLRFSNDGKWLLGMLEGKVYVMDAFNGTLVRT